MRTLSDEAAFRAQHLDQPGRLFRSLGPSGRADERLGQGDDEHTHTRVAEMRSDAILVAERDDGLVPAAVETKTT